MIHMGITPAPNYRLYWTKDKQFRISGIAEVMSRDRFEQIKRFIYFNTFQEANRSEDSLRKLKSIYNAISKSCKDHWKGSTNLSIDEPMIAFSGEHCGTVYVPRKPIKNGFKMFVLADVTGYVIKFFPSFLRVKDTVQRIVFDLISDVLTPNNHHLFMDK